MSELEYHKMSERLDVHREREFFNDEETADIKLDFFGRMVTIMIAALGLITALAWDRTLEDIFTSLFGPLNSLSRKISYAVLITVLAVVLSIILRKYFIRKKRRARKL